MRRVYSISLTCKTQPIEFVRLNLEVPAVLKEDAAPMVRIHNRMLRARILKLQGNEGCKEEQAAFQLLRDGLLEAVAGKKNYPKLKCLFGSDRMGA